MTMSPQVTVWFDSSCPLCQREIALMRRLDRRGAIRFIDACDPEGSCPIDRSELLARFHAEEAGKLLSGAQAFAAMWRAIPLLRPLGLLAGWKPVTPLFEAAYRRFLLVRPRLQRLVRSRSAV
ncbi:MAG: thiol-disulfide oxidoreductase DCC family protein [Allorhizobium sp.]